MLNEQEKETSKITSYTLNGKTYHAGEYAKTDIGTFTIHSDGLLKANGAAMAEEAYLHQVTYTVGRKGSGKKISTSTLDFTLDNSQNETLKNNPLKLATLVDSDESWQATHNGIGSVLNNTQNVLNGKILPDSDFKVTSFTIDGTTYEADSIAQLQEGTFELKSTGQYSFVSAMRYFYYYDVDIHYTVSNGETSNTSVLKFSYDLENLSKGDPYEVDNYTLHGKNNTVIMIGDIHRDHSSDSVLSAKALGIDVGKVILIGDQLNVAHLNSHDHRGNPSTGKQYFNSIEAVRDYLAFENKSNTEADIVQFIQSFSERQLAKFLPQGGDDILIGADGNDTIIGGSGDDTLTGNGGRDTFIFSGDSGHDVITDFTKGEDRIVLSDLLNSESVTWDIDSSVLRFTSSVPGYESGSNYAPPVRYENTITILNATPDLTLKDLLGHA